MGFGFFRRTPQQQAEDTAKIEASLAKTRQGFFGRVQTLFQANEITDDTWDELEEILIQADLGINTALGVVERLRKRVERDHLKRVDDVKAALKDELVKLLDHPPLTNIEEPRMLTVVLIVGVNGSGKTTSIAKLAKYYKARGKRVVLAAADTFRAAAIDQLKIWGERTGVEVIAQGPGADPGAVVYDAIRASQETRSADLLIIDTAGRLHTKYNLMKELEKVRAVCAAAGPRGAARDAAGARRDHRAERHQPGQALQRRGRNHRHHPDQARRHGQGRDRLRDPGRARRPRALRGHGREGRRLRGIRPEGFRRWDYGVTHCENERTEGHTMENLVERLVRWSLCGATLFAQRGKGTHGRDTRPTSVAGRPGRRDAEASLT